ncbi:ribonuclease Y-like [Channa argus]|uniref:ribonuclease Y-like n=1 Tax=Channa argus TaxID=215402 RepID=UPI002946306A|nr:hypothetical protein Q8A73_012703 [Channa argus]
MYVQEHSFVKRDVDAADSGGEVLGSTQSSIFSASCTSMGLICGFAGLTVGLLIAVAVFYKYRRNRNNGRNGNYGGIARNEENKNQELVKLLTDLKGKLEDERDQIKPQLITLEGQREENRQKLQSVEKEITAREMTFDKPEELLKQKEKLLNEQWVLDQRKKDLEKHLLDNERLVEPIEIWHSKRPSSQ